MHDWRATRPVDVARLNSGVFLAVLRKFAVAAAICAPVYFGAIIVLAEVRAPQLSIGFVLAHVWLYFLTAFVGHLALGLVIMTFCTAVGSLIWWLVVRRDPGALVLRAIRWFPGEAWLGYTCTEDELVQVGSLRPKGIPGFLYWKLLQPVHRRVFQSLARHRVTRAA